MDPELITHAGILLTDLANIHSWAKDPLLTHFHPYVIKNVHLMSRLLHTAPNYRERILHMQVAELLTKKN
jgi:hypothetical protein